MIDAPPDAVAADVGVLWRRILSVRGEMVWIVIGQAAAASGGIVGVKLLTHWLSPAIYGQLALGLTLTTLVLQSVLTPFTGAALRFFSAAREAEELVSFLTALKHILLVAVAIIVFCMVIGIAIVFFKHQRAWVPIIFWCAVFALFSGFSQALDGMQNAARQRIIVAWHDGLGVWLRFLMGTLAVIMMGAHAANALSGYAVAALLVFGSQYYFFRRGLVQYTRDIPDRRKIKKWRNAIVAYGSPFAAWGIFTWAQVSSERWALQIFGDTAQVGQYAVLYQLGYYPIALLCGMSMKLFSPVMFQIAGDGTDADRVGRCHRLAGLLALAGLIATFLVAFFARLFGNAAFRLIVPPDYRSAEYLLPLMVLSGGIFTVGQFISLGLMSESSTKPLIAPKIATAVLAMGFNAIGAAYGGLRGVVLASLAFSIIYSIWIFVLACDRSAHFISRARRGISHRFRDAYRRFVLRDPVAIATRRWFKEKADSTLRLNYPLSRASVVLDLGGYHGDWASKIHERYGARIHIFEPVPAFAAIIKQRFENVPNIRIYEYGLAAENIHTSIAISEDSSSTVRAASSQTLDIELRDVAEFVDSMDVTQIDLMKINIEGGEFVLLRHLIDRRLIERFINIQVQFHEFVPNAWAQREAIRKELSRTHQLTYDFPFVWENWQIRTGRRDANGQNGDS